MLTFIKSYSLIIIKKKLILLYFLNLLDIIFTYFLLRTGLFWEINLLLSDPLQHPLRIIFLKVFLPAILLFFIYCRLQKASTKQLILSNMIINLVNFFYLLVNFTHIIWIILIPFFSSI